MSSDLVVQANNLGKKFKIYKKPWDRAREWLAFGTRTYHTDFWALKEIAFELRRGEALGIIGQNGAGKSTLLKMLTGAMFATEGSFQINGRVLSILELGTGFNPELTGRQNVYNSAHLLGFPEEYVAIRIGDIEAFADIDDFFDRPLKMYSSGMRARLAFSMFAFLDCDLLIIDEVLSVGDVFFTQKCYARLDELRSRDRAIILVTHNNSIIQQFCSRAIVLDRGRMVFSGASAEAAMYYFYIKNHPGVLRNGTNNARGQPHPQLAGSSFVKRSPDEPFERQNQAWQPGAIRWPHSSAFLDITNAVTIGEGWGRCTVIAICDDDGNPCQAFRSGQRAHWYYEFEVLHDLLEPSGSVAISNDRNIRVHGKNTMQLGVNPVHHIPKGTYLRFHQSIVLNIAPGEYTFNIALAAMNSNHIRAANELSSAQKRFLANNVERAGAFRVIGEPGPYSGLCDLPGTCEVELCPPTPSIEVRENSMEEHLSKAV
jgi:lipopolysaccharide transport system ATP-binding protein